MQNKSYLIEVGTASKGNSILISLKDEAIPEITAIFFLYKIIVHPETSKIKTMVVAPLRVT